MGQIFDALQQTGQLDDTMIIFTSDNGYFHGDHGLGDKRAAYDEALRIPLLVRYPKLVRAGTKITEDVLNTDIAPTCLELSGAKRSLETRNNLSCCIQGGWLVFRKDFWAHMDARNAPAGAFRALLRRCRFDVFGGLNLRLQQLGSAKPYRC
jgi:hypothetical protein